MKTTSMILIISLCSLVLFSSNLFAKKPGYEKNKKFKNIPYGLQKKLHRTGELPPGWKKKLVTGNFVSAEVLSRGVILDPRVISKWPEPKHTKIYEIEDKIIRINRATNIILDVLK